MWRVLCLLLFLPHVAFGLDTSYEFIIDLSGSMNRYEAGDTLKGHILKSLYEMLPAERRYAMRVFGHRVSLDDKEKGCADSELIFSFAKHDSESVKKKIFSLSAQGYTPLAYSLSKIEQDLLGVEGKRVVIVLSDGVDSCDGDPAEEVERLRARGIDIVVNPIGIGLDRSARAQLSELASITGGKFLEVKDPKELAYALRSALDHINGPLKARELPGDLNGDKDAGEDQGTALSVAKNEWMVGVIGSRRGVLQDNVDYFSFPSSPGEKFVLQLEVLSGRKISGSVLDADNNELATISDQTRESELTAAPLNGDRVFLRFKSIEDKEVRYRFKIVPLVEIN